MASIEIRPVPGGDPWAEFSDAPAGGPYAGAIAGIESGGDYKAIGPATRDGDRALGKYQVMGKNVGPWSEEALGRRLSPQEFLISPEAQDAVFQHRFGSYVDKYGPEGAARAWFAGEGGMNDPNRRDVLGTTVADYARKFSGGQAAQAAPAPKDQWAEFKDAPAAKPSQEAVEPKTDIGRTAAALIGFGQGATANFGDEIAGVMSAAQLPSDISSALRAVGPLGTVAEPLVGLARLGYEYMTGGDEAAKRYSAARDQFRKNAKDAEAQHPGYFTAGNVGGAIALPLSKALQAATLGGRMVRGAAVGAGFGGASGIGEGEEAADRASRGLVGAGTGLVAGAAASPIIEGTAKLAGAAVSKPVNIMRAAVNPQGAAERAVGRAYLEAQRTDPQAVARLTPQDLTPNGPGIVLDTLGGEGRNLARSAANLSGGARDTLNRTLDERFESQGNRFVTWLNNTFNFPNAHAQQQAIDKIEKTVNNAAYKRAYQQGDTPLWSPELERLVGSPAVQDAMRSAITTGKDRAITQGYGGFRSPVTATPDGRLAFNRGPNGVPTYPNLQFWDYTRREISNAASKGRRAGADEEASRLGDLAGKLNAELDRLAPAYQDARQGAAKFFGAENALEAGQKFVTENFNNQQTRAALAKMSSVERQLFQDGFVSRYMEMLNNVPDRADVVRKIYNSTANREKIEIALGKQKATELEAMVRIEGIMNMGLRAVQGNSTTAMQIAGLGLAGAAGGGYLGFDPTTSGVAAALATAGKRGIDTRVAQRVAELLTSKDPAALNHGIKTVASNARLMSALRSIDSAGARVGGNQIQTSVPALQAPVIGRAEDEQPSIPRPPGQ